MSIPNLGKSRAATTQCDITEILIGTGWINFAPLINYTPSYGTFLLRGCEWNATNYTVIGSLVIRG